jgi:hypothetical protein
MAERSWYKIGSKAENSQDLEILITCKGAGPGAGLVTCPKKWLGTQQKA